SLSPGNYLICEVPRSEERRVGKECSFWCAASGVEEGGFKVTVTSGSSATGKDFGNFRQGTVSGTKFEDPNADGTLTDGTAPAGATAWTIRAYTDVATRVLVSSTTSNTATWTYSLSLSPGNYLICEVP